MDKRELEELVRRVAMEVLAAQGAACAQTPSAQGRARVLLLGGGLDTAPEELSERSVLLDAADYERSGNILRYDKVVITRLEICQLSDLALVRPRDTLTRAVTEALLCGVEVLMTPDAPVYQKYAGRGSAAVYKALDAYARTLQVYGVKVLSRKKGCELPPPQPPRFQKKEPAPPRGSCVPNGALLVTQEDAARMLEQGIHVHLCKGAILTPLARDLFAQAGAVVTRD